MILIEYPRLLEGFIRFFFKFSLDVIGRLLVPTDLTEGPVS